MDRQGHRQNKINFEYKITRKTRQGEKSSLKDRRKGPRRGSKKKTKKKKKPNKKNLKRRGAEKDPETGGIKKAKVFI